MSAILYNIYWLALSIIILELQLSNLSVLIFLGSCVSSDTVEDLSVFNGLDNCEVQTFSEGAILTSVMFQKQNFMRIPQEFLC